MADADSKKPAADGAEPAGPEEPLRRVDEMFAGHRKDPIMREIRRLAIKSIREKWFDA
ncbi:MAG: hypothetical protein LBU64_10885 [Planctomycetota bacterium]|jgi:hypothetical protein|nr:hypothetical protein [Planctomycetota bacterium]